MLRTKSQPHHIPPTVIELALEIQFYDRKNSLLKTLTFSDYKPYGKYWRANTMKMVNHQNKKQTVLKFSEIKFGIDLTEEDFTQNALKRAK